MVKMEKIYIITFAMILGTVIGFYFKMETYLILGLNLLFIGIYIFIQDKYRDIILFSLITFFSMLNFSLFVYEGSIASGDIYEMNVIVEENKISVKKIGGKYSLDNIFLDINSFNDQNGYYKMKVLVNKVSEFEYYTILEGRLKSYDTNFFNKIRNSIHSKLYNLSMEKSEEFYGFSKAVILGEKDFIADDINESFRNTGTSHLLVISGLHIGIIIIFSIKILEILGVGYKKRYISAAIFLTIFAATAGFTASVTRAYIMGIIFLFSKILGEKYDIKKAISLSIIISITINPSAIFTVSFQLSYMALFGIIFIYKYFQDKIKDKFFQPIFFSLSIQLALFPIFWFYFNQIPLLSFIPNIIAVPFGSLIVQLLFLGLLISYVLNPIAKIIYNIAYYLFLVLIKGIEFLEHMPLLQIETYNYVNGLSIIVIYLIFSLVFISKMKWEKRSYSLMLLILLFINLNIRKTPDYLRINNNVFLKTDETKILLNNSGMDGNDIINLDKHGIKSVDFIITKTEISRYEKMLNPEKIIKIDNKSKVIIGEAEFINTKGEIEPINFDAFK